MMDDSDCSNSLSIHSITNSIPIMRLNTKQVKKPSESPIDTIEEYEDIGDITCEEVVRGRNMFEEIPMPGVENGEADRKQQWLKLPSAARVTIRRLHVQFLGNYFRDL